MTSPGLAHWARVVDGKKDVDQAAVAQMAALPGFADACRLGIRMSLAQFGSDPLMARATKDFSQLYYGFFVLYLDARAGLTLKAIQDFCQEMGLASPGRAAAILIHLRAIGYVVPDPQPGDRRVRRYLPAPQMKAALRDVIITELRAFALLEPDAQRIAKRCQEPEFFRAYVLRLGQGLANSVKTRRPSPTGIFAERNAGLFILFDILASAEPGDTYPPRGRVRMSVAGLAKKFKVSRSHVFRLLQDTEKLGYLKRDADEQTGEITDVLRTALVEFHAYVFMALATCGYHASLSNSAAIEAQDDPIT